MTKATKQKQVFICQQCGTSSPRWMGRCSACGEWNSLVEEAVLSTSNKKLGWSIEHASTTQAQLLSEVKGDSEDRIQTHLEEFDRVLGGGLVKGAVVLVGGDPGIGKSTLLLQALDGIAKQGIKTLYISGEESASQISLRAERLGVKDSENIFILSTVLFEKIESAIEKLKPDVVIIDSIQTVATEAVDSAPGTVSQLREVSSRLVQLAKSKSIGMFLIGHVTKDGAIAGPKVLEHLVDVVLSFEGDDSYLFRMVRAKKNRFGSTHELGVFEMAKSGLEQVSNPSSILLKERRADSSGSMVVPVAEGSRSLLIEVQALVASAAYGSARRVASGLDANRLAILLAVIEKKLDLPILDQDVFASVAGGVKVDERGLDLGLALAILSSFRNQPVHPNVVAFGEIGLSGEVRAVPRAPARIQEAHKLGFEKIILPQSNMESLDQENYEGLTLYPVKKLEEVLELAF